MTDTPTPVQIAPIGPTLPHAGVMATRPATTAVAPPSAVGLPRWTHSINAHVTTAVEAAVPVLRKASVASGLALSALPALKPNHPVHRRPGWFGVVRFQRGQRAQRQSARDETEPPRPQEAGPDQAERQAVRRHWFLPEAVALTKEEGRHDGGEAARHVDHETAREVDCARLEDPALR